MENPMAISIQRRALWSTMALGVLITTVGATGIFAVFQDSAIQGPNTLNSGSRAKAADIQLAVGTLLPTGIDCPVFSEGIATALWSAANIQPGYQEDRFVCIQNVGSASVSVSLLVQDAVDTDVLCTGDEATLDPTCGLGAGHGSLSSLLDVAVQIHDCSNGSPGPAVVSVNDFVNLESTPADTGATIGPGIVKCLWLAVLYPATTPETDAQTAQTDSVTWKFAFDATAL
jgi:hypothetical protein